MTNITENKFESRNSLLKALGCDIMQILSNALMERDYASMLLSAGTTPGPLYEALSKEDIDWSKVWLAPTDERWVELDHKDSNEKFITNTLLKNKAKNAHYMSLKSSAETPQLGQKQCRQNIENLPKPYDIVLLGMGEDGHVASLFPQLPDTMDALAPNNDQLCHAIDRPNGQTARMTMTLNNLLTSKRVYLFFYGAKKLAIYEAAKKQRQDQLPVSYILHQNNVPISLYWTE